MLADAPGLYQSLLGTEPWPGFSPTRSGKWREFIIYLLLFFNCLRVISCVNSRTLRRGLARVAVLIVGCQFDVRGGASCGQLRPSRDDIERSHAGAQPVCLK
jgi:hypothetical protein